MAIDGKKVIRRYDEGKQILSNRLSRIQFMAPYIDPSRMNVLSDITVEGQPWMSNVYDGQGIFANDLGALYLNGHATNAATKWFGLRERQQWLNQEDEVMEWLQESRDRMLALLASSNAYAEFHELYKDWWGFGTGESVLEERPLEKGRPQFGFRGVRVSSDKIGRYVIRRDGWGRVNGLDREFMLSVEAAVGRYGIDNVSEKIRECFRNERYSEQFKFVQSIYPREPSEYGNKANQRMPWVSCYVEYDNKNVVKESGYKRFPAVVPVQMAVFGEIYGRGRADIAINDIMTLNSAKRMGFEDWALKIRPMTFVDNEAVWGTINLKPGSFPPARRQGNRPLSDLFYQYQTGSHPEVSQIKEEELRKSIREAFFVDHLRELIIIQGQKEMTAYEYGRKEALVQSLIAPFYSRLQIDFHIPFIDNLFDMMYEAKQFSPPPDILLNEGGTIDVEFESPLARAQRNDEVVAMESYVQSLSGLAELQAKFGGKGVAEVLDIIDGDEYARLLARIKGVPAGPIRSVKQVATIRESRAREEEDASINQELMGGAEALGKAAPFLKAVQDQKAA